MDNLLRKASANVILALSLTSICFSAPSPFDGESDQKYKIQVRVMRDLTMDDGDLKTGEIGTFVLELHIRLDGDADHTLLRQGGDIKSRLEDAGLYVFSVPVEGTSNLVNASVSDLDSLRPTVTRATVDFIDTVARITLHGTVFVGYFGTMTILSTPDLDFEYLNDDGEIVEFKDISVKTQYKDHISSERTFSLQFSGSLDS
ncbi:MAG: hypothetical protein IH945_12700, partial [Armatimonadetes bacterium]|nr:hypothetical protein [Armatimonadota bacterium]